MVTQEQCELFEKALAFNVKTIIPLPALWQAFGQLFPSEVGSVHAREIMAELIESLQKKEFRLPVTPSKYDRTAAQPLPLWVKRPAEAIKGNFSPDKHLWAPELVFFGSQKHLLNHQIWLKIDQWLKQTNRSNRQPIPIKERSYEIFRDEKALDSLRKTKPFQEGLITLENLRCFVIYEPLPTEFGPESASGKPALIVENPTTHWTIANWNKTAGRYSCVIYGSGNKISAAWEWLLWKKDDYNYSEIKYFGDIDIVGFEIPLRVKKNIAALSNLSFSLDVDLYRLALQLEEGNLLPKCKGKITTKMNLLSDFPDLVASKINEILLKGERIPQEVVSEEDLTKFLG